jgi:hypothetical protein
MSDTISRQAAIDALDGKLEITGRTNAEAVKGYVRLVKDRLERLPSEQPEIIRCKDCRYYQDNNDGYPHINCKWDANETPDADDFCSGAERREHG